MTESVTAWTAPIPTIDWARLGHVYAVANGKGGVGKTTTTANLGALVASDGAPTLIIDLNGQGNIAHILGFANTDLDDHGRGLFSAITGGAALAPVKGVRENLDVVPGGPFVRRIGAAVAGDMMSQETVPAVLLSLADGLQRIAHRYQLIIIDTPPENPLLLEIALCAARFIVVPMKTELMSQFGLRELAGEIRRMREFNEFLTLLGVFAFASGTSATKVRKEMNDQVTRDLGAQSEVMMSSFIRHSEAVANDMTKYGRVAHELEQEIANNPKYWELRSGTAKSTAVVSSTSKPVARDFAKLAKEMLTRAGARRAEMIEQGVWP
ncbi:ParA family protein [Mycolicibacterium bacteremicum]|jgi:chromosome partitioning protein|uniref:ParA family protein n=1 Tax=Mycolicibacterium bacteremicum TaxID=564198 RepID=UPI0026EA0459|nr:ParA family protein [Mycolicibacterium bacteremicum]